MPYIYPIAIGSFKESKRVYDYLLKLNESEFYVPTETKNRAWHRRESMMYYASHFYTPLSTYNTNTDLERIIIGESSKHRPFIPNMTTYTSYEDQPGINLEPRFIASAEFNNSVTRILKETNTYSSWIVLNTTGFLKNQVYRVRYIGLGYMRSHLDLFSPLYPSPITLSYNPLL